MSRRTLCAGQSAMNSHFRRIRLTHQLAYSCQFRAYAGSAAPQSSRDRIQKIGARHWKRNPMKTLLTVFALSLSLVGGATLLQAQTTNGMVPFTIDHRRGAL